MVQGVHFGNSGDATLLQTPGFGVAARLRRYVSWITLTWRFAIAAFIITFAVGYVALRILENSVTASSIGFDIETTRDTKAVRAASRLLPADLVSPLSGAHYSEFDRFARQSLLSAHTTHVLIWNPDGRIIYADEPELLGLTFPLTQGITQALKGKSVAARLTGRSKASTPEARYRGLLAVSVPLRFTDSTRVAGVFEAYNEYGTVAQRVAGIQHDVRLALAGGLVLLYLVLVGIVHQGTRTIDRQQRDLRKAFAGQSRMTAIIETTPDFVAVIDATEHVSYFNHAGRRMLGIGDQANLSTDSIAPYLHEPLSQFMALHTPRTGVQDGTWTGETTLLARDGAQIPVSQVLLAHRGDSASADYYSIVARDITERKRAEAAVGALNESLEQRVVERTKQLALTNHELRRAKHEADAANGAKSEFLSRMSHELRTPMNAILGFAQLLEMDPLEPQQRSGVEKILSAGEHLLVLINEVLDMTRIEAGRLDLSPEAVAVGTIVMQCRPLVSSLAAARRVRLDLNERPLGAVFVRADAQRLKQVILNLLSNAVKYNRDGGTVTLTGRKRDDGRLRIEVQDTGIGIAAEKLSRLYSPFDRLGAEQSKVEGSGLGLSLSKSLAEAMGGSIGVTSVEGEGSCFWLELPLVESPLAAAGIDEPATTEPDPVVVSTKTVLYIEDNLSNLEVVERLLNRRPGVKLLTAMQGGLGIELAQKHHPDLILLDLHLPDTTGDIVLQQLQADETLRRVPVVMVSADATPKQIERLLAGGAREYLTKPLNLRRFMQVVDGILQETL
ncbi:MAG: ATP-binding protein [Dehalococcoidia bacterium]